MCLILIAHHAHPRYRLVVASNRDEFFQRPTAGADYWQDAPHVLAGRDNEKGGTWMGIARDGRWAAITNFRDGERPAPGARSRGELVANYLRAPAIAPQAYVSSTWDIAALFPGFNLLVGDLDELHYVSNKDEAPLMLAAGVYGLSNGLLDAPWPKVERGKLALREGLGRFAAPDRLIDTLLDALSDRTLAADHMLPDTGVGRDWEKQLSAAFIRAPGYGTRASTVLLADHDGEVHLRERSFAESGALIEERRFRFALEESRASTPG
jgi:uncharacterized protein with NRDE domain